MAAASAAPIPAKAQTRKNIISNERQSKIKLKRNIKVSNIAKRVPYRRSKSIIHNIFPQLSIHLHPENSSERMN